ncbi:MAG: tetratricopeptide repeat protein [Myxococcales bacterium]|nr:tetratricopeptide repeat protein [Myxococcales bacterium]
MAVDRTKVLAAAQKHLAKGAYDRAIAEYQKLVDADPRDVRTLLKIGDLYTRKGSNKEASATYFRVAEHYATQGFFLKAVAVYKQILKLQPGRLDISLRLAEMYENLQLVSDALATYEQVAAAYAREGQVDQALSTLGKMCELDPENVPVRIKYAEALSKAGRTEEAAVAFEAGAGLLEEQGRLDDYLKVAERLLFHRPTDADLARKLASHYLERDDAKRALAKLQLCFKQDPRDVRTLELLAEAFHALGQTPKTISVYREIARIHQEANRAEARARVLKRILELDPTDAEARQALAGYASVAAPRPAPPPAAPVEAMPPGALVAPPPAEEDEDDEPDLELLEPDDDDDMLLEVDEEEVVVDVALDADEGSMAPPPPDHAPSIPPDVALEAQIARLLTECDVFARYGLKDKVVAQLEQVLQLAPDHVEARERLKDAYLAAGRPRDAARELVHLASMYGDRPQVAQLYLREATELDPSSVPTGTHDLPSAETETETESGRASEEDLFFLDDRASAPELPGSPATETVTLDEARDDEVLFVDQTPAPAAPDEVLFVDETPAPVEGPPTSAPPGAPEASFDEAAPSDVQLLDEGLGDGLLMLDEGAPLASAADFDDATALVSPAHLESPPLAGPDDFDDATAFVPPPSFASPSFDSPPRPAYVPGPPSSIPSLAPPEPVEDLPPAPAHVPDHIVEARQRASIPPGEIEETLDEVDFFIAQGLFDAARATVEDALSSHPDHPILREKHEEILEHLRAASAARASVVPDEDEAFMLAERLAEELGDEPVEDLAGSDVLDVDEVFEQFKRGVEQQIGLEDTDTHFDLGIAYKEMGLIDDAKKAFELAMRNPQRECLCHTMIGLCLMEQNKPTDAISRFKKGLYAEQKTEREELGLYFELGNAYELLQDPKEALYYYQKVAKRDAGFRNVEDCIARLTNPGDPGTAMPDALVLDDVDAAFDDLLGDD